MFYRSTSSVWTWLYTIIICVNLTACPSAAFLARHLGVDPEKAWRMLGQIRDQISAICKQASLTLDGQTVYAENLRFGNVLSDTGRKTGYTHVIIIATEHTPFAFVVPRRHPFYYRQIFKRLGVNRDIYTYDRDFNNIGKTLEGYRVHLLDPKEKNSTEASDRARSGRAFAVYLTRSIRKWPRKIKRIYLQSYLDEFVWRFNFARDKAMMFPSFMMSLEKVAYCDSAEASTKIRHFNRRISQRIPRRKELP